MTTRNVFAMLIACCIVLIFAECAQAAPTCGGEAGTARRVGVDGPVTLTADQTTNPPIYIGPDGYWTRCPTPAPPPKPQACSGDGQPATWTVGDHTCTTARPRHAESNSARRQGLQHGRLQTLQQWLGPMRGTIIERCTDGVRSVVSATCNPATECDTGWSKSDGGVTYTINARPAANRIPLGGYAQATGSDGSTLRVQCRAGEIVAAPQCVGPQRVSRLYTTETRIYEYAGPAVEPGKLVRAEQLHVIRDGVELPGKNKIRWTLARCAGTGRLQ